jgi:hypothetical protein
MHAAKPSSAKRRTEERGAMKKLAVFGGATIGGYVGWYLGAKFGIMTAFILSMLGTGIGTYYGAKFAREYEA